MDREQAIRMLGFRDAKGALVDPTKVLDLAKPYRVCLRAENDSWKPTPEELNRVGTILKELGIKGGIFAEVGTGGLPFFNRAGIVICRFIESRVDAPVAPAQAPKKVEPAPAPIPAPAPVSAKVAEDLPLMLKKKHKRVP